MIFMKTKIIPLTLISILLFLTGGLSLVAATADLDGNGLENGDLDRDRDRDRDGDCDRDEEGNDGTPCDGKMNRYGPQEDDEPEMVKFRKHLMWQYQNRWNPTPE